METITLPNAVWEVSMNGNAKFWNIPIELWFRPEIKALIYPIWIYTLRMFWETACTTRLMLEEWEELYEAE